MLPFLAQKHIIIKDSNAQHITKNVVCNAMVNSAKGDTKINCSV